MTAVNPFVLEKEDYKRELNVLGHCVKQHASYLSTITSKPLEYCRDYVVKQLKPGGKFEFKDPQVRYLERGENGDRTIQVGTMSQYLKDINDRQDLVAPTFTTYLPPHVKQSVISIAIEGNIKARNVAKKEMFQAIVAKNDERAVFKKNEQNNKKTSNNSFSGGHVSSSSPLFNPTAHSTLTSNCRTTSAYGNANNEKMITGNRHYHNPNLVANNIISIITNTDYEVLAQAMAAYDLRDPTVEETLECIKYSTDLYWRNQNAHRRIRVLVERLTGIQRSAFVYTGDLHHLRKHNDAVVRTFISDLIEKSDVVDSTPKETLEAYREEYRPLVNQFFPEQMKGKTLSTKEDAFIGKSDPETYGRIASTVKHVAEMVQQKYALFIRAFLVTKNAPASLAYLPLSVRRSALVSDTDSTIFTVQSWSHWYTNSTALNETTSAVSATMIFLAAETITHILARMSANFGIETKRIFTVAMKNEYKFNVFVTTPVGKHYYGVMTGQEGNLYDKLKMEIKGVHLKSSNVPVSVMKQAKNMMQDIIQTVERGEKIKLTKYLKEIGDLEREVKRSVLAGEGTYFRKAQIKIAKAYVNGEESAPYQAHLFWQEVFSPKYGAAVLPYGCLKVSVEVDSKVALAQWVAAIEDKALALRMTNWLLKTKKNGMTTILISEEVLSVNGMPKEIAQVMNMRKIIHGVTGVFYLIMESLGFYCLNKNLTRLISDEY